MLFTFIQELEFRDIKNELNTHPNMNFIENYSSTWKNNVLPMPCSGIPLQILSY
jgi:hypothetical protein